MKQASGDSPHNEMVRENEMRKVNLPILHTMRREVIAELPILHTMRREVIAELLILHTMRREVIAAFWIEVSGQLNTLSQGRATGSCVSRCVGLDTMVNRTISAATGN
jgi:hypothetical protein